MKHDVFLITMVVMLAVVSVYITAKSIEFLEDKNQRDMDAYSKFFDPIN